MHVLYEHPVGYVLMKAKEEDVVSAKEIVKSIESYKMLRRAYEFSGLLALAGVKEAQEEMEAASEGRITEKLKEFLSIHGVKVLAADSSYSQALKDLGISVANRSISDELLRGVRKHADQILSLEPETSRRAAASLAHIVSRKKIKYDTKREDNSVMQCISLVDEVNNDINEYYMKVKEMYSWHFPELQSILHDPREYLAAVAVIRNRSGIKDADKAVADLEKKEEILSALERTIGGDITDEDMQNIDQILDMVFDKTMLRDKAMSHLEKRMSVVSPNLSALVGPVVGARLILRAGGLSKLAMCSSSTVQILGAEKALFRALRTKTKTPKYGLLFNSSFINKSSQKMRGRISRYLSSKCSIASRIDCYSTEALTDKYGSAMKEMVEERMKGKSTRHMPTDQVLARVYEEVHSSTN